MTGYLQLNIDTKLGTNRLTGNVGVQLVNTDQRVSSGKLSESGFRFAHPNLGDALRHLLMR